MTKHKNIGSNFDDFLAEEGELDEVTAVATERVIAWERNEAMWKKDFSESGLKMRT